MSKKILFKNFLLIYLMLITGLYAVNKNLSFNISYLVDNIPEVDTSFYYPLKYFSLGGDFSFFTDLNSDFSYQNYTFAINEKFNYEKKFEFYIGLGYDYLPNAIMPFGSFFISTKIHSFFYMNNFFTGFHIDNFHFSNGINSYLRGFFGYKINTTYIKLGYQGLLSFTKDVPVYYYNGLFAGIEYEF